LKLGGLGGANTFLRAQVGIAGAVQTRQSLKLSEQPLGHAHCILARYPHAQEDSEQLGVAEHGRTFAREPLAGPVAAWQILDARLVIGRRISLCSHRLALPRRVYSTQTKTQNWRAFQATN